MAKVRVLPAFLVLLVLVAGGGDLVGVKMAEGRICASQSEKFKGVCVSETNCKHVCQTEGFQGGDCRGARRRCFCTKRC